MAKQTKLKPEPKPDYSKVVEALKGNVMHKHPNTDREEYWVMVDRQKWKDLRLYDEVEWNDNR